MRFYLIIIISLAVFSNISYAQNEIIIEPDSFQESFEEDINEIILFRLDAFMENSLDTVLSINWEIVDINIPTEWSLSISDKIIEYLPGITENVLPVILDAGEMEVPFRVSIYPNETPGCGSFNAIITRSENGSHLDSITYLVSINEEDCILSSVQNFSYAPIIEIYPNPSPDVVQIDAESRISHISVFNLEGKRFLNYTIDPTRNLSLQTANWNDGIYILKLVFEDGRKTVTKLVKG